MSDTSSDQLVARYLERLDHALGELPAQRRRELVSEIAAHIASARADLDDSEEAGVLDVLERLGEPEDIAASAGRQPQAGPAPAPRPGFVEVLALILLPIGGVVVPVLGWFVGVALLWVSRMWTTRDKLIGTFVLPFGLLGVGVLGLMPFSAAKSCTGNGEQIVCTGGPSPFMQVAGPLLLVVMVVAPLASMAYLGWRLSRR